MLAETLTVTFPVDEKPDESMAVRTMVFGPTVAPQSAATVAEMTPPVFVSPVTVRPAGTDVTETPTLPGV